MSDPQIDNDVSDVDDEPIIEKVKLKKERTPAQKEACNKMIEARQKKANEQLELKAYREEKLKRLEEKEQEKLNDKIVKKAIQIKKKGKSKLEMLQLLDSDSESDSEPDAPTKPPKRPVVKTIKKTLPPPPKREPEKQQPAPPAFKFLKKGYKV